MEGPIKKSTSSALQYPIEVATSELHIMHKCVKCGQHLHSVYTDPNRYLKACICGMRYSAVPDVVPYSIPLHSALLLDSEKTNV